MFLSVLFYFFTILGILYFAVALYEIFTAPKGSLIAVIIAENKEELYEKIKENLWKPSQEQLKK